MSCLACTCAMCTVSRASGLVHVCRLPPLPLPRCMCVCVCVCVCARVYSAFFSLGVHVCVSCSPPAIPSFDLQGAHEGGDRKGCGREGKTPQPRATAPHGWTGPALTHLPRHRIDGQDQPWRTVLITAWMSRTSLVAPSSSPYDGCPCAQTQAAEPP